MHNWFECKIRYEKVAENGMNKKVIEPYLVDALSFTEAESRIIEEITPFISGEFTVADIKRANYSELFPCEEDAADRWFKCKLYFITLDEKSGTEKKTATNVLVQAADLRDAVKKPRRRHERDNGRLCNCISGRNRYHGCISLFGRTGRKAGISRSGQKITDKDRLPWTFRKT